ncbi:uncharacterized protein LOC131615196 [Vicia villosa]|uniref:uncharacterized protein LOC131615196 n=1 Tax=Vicia villosa TaxID=3911 RepID=UPI00273B48F0|nr:uncharacterized protein LOC131615196 [Vicia villosa]
MVLEEARATIVEHEWRCAEWYVTWYNRVSHPYMLPTAPGDPPKSAHEEILHTHQAKLDHTQDLLPRYRQIADTDLVAISDGLSYEGSEQRHVVDVMIRLTQKAFMYSRHCVRTVGALNARGRATRGRDGCRRGGRARGR